MPSRHPSSSATSAGNPRSTAVAMMALSPRLRRIVTCGAIWRIYVRHLASQQPPIHWRSAYFSQQTLLRRIHTDSLVGRCGNGTHACGDVVLLHANWLTELHCEILL